MSFAQDLPKQTEYLEKGMVADIVQEKHDIELEKLFLTEQIVQTLKIKILTGKLQDREFNIENYLTSNPAFDINLKKGDRVLLEMDNPEDTKNINITAKDNSPMLLIVLGVFALSIMLVAGYQGMKSLISTIIAIFLIFFVLVPLLLKGFEAIPTTIAIISLSTIFTMFILGGINIKSLSAATGTIISLIFAGILSSIVIYTTSLNGISSQESLILWDKYHDLNFKGILSSAVIVGSLGAVMNIAMSITNCINEVKKSREDYGFKELFHSGLNIGKETIGPMTNTLIFAYLASSMPLVLLSLDTPFIKFINFQSVIIEILAALIGSIAIVYCAPITAAISAYLTCKLTAQKTP